MSRFNVELSVPEGTPAEEFEVHLRAEGEDDAAWVHLLTSTGTKFQVDRLPSTGRYELGIGYRVAGSLVDPDKWTIVPIRTDSTSDLPAPSPPGNFTSAQDGPLLRFGWRVVESGDISHYEIRRGSDWDAGVWIADVPHPLTSFIAGWWASGSQTHQIRTVTRAGVKSTTSAESIITVRADPYDVLQASTAEATSFSGTKTGTEVSGSQLRPTVHPASYASWTNTYTTYTDLWWAPVSMDGTYVTSWIDAGAVGDERLEIDLTIASASNISTDYNDYRFAVHPPADESGNAVGPGWRERGAYGLYGGGSADGVRLRVEIDTAQDATPTPEGYRDWIPGATYRYRQYRLRLTFLNSWPFVHPRISVLTHRRLRRNLKDEQAATVVSVGGTTVNFSTPFQSAPKVTASAISTTALFASVSNVTASSCKIYLWDAAGSEQGSGTVHVIATGV